MTQLQSIRLACEAGVKWVQLRVKEQSEEQVFETAMAAKEICEQWGASLTINDYPKVAKRLGAYGIHLGKEDMPLKEARDIIRGMILGGTANTFEDIRQHAESGADYVGVGPYRFTTTKKKLSPVLGQDGYRLLLKKCSEAGIKTPVLAIGGLKLGDIEDLIEAGVYGIAVSSLIVQAPDPKRVVERINTILEKPACV